MDTSHKGCPGHPGITILCVVSLVQRDWNNMTSITDQEIRVFIGYSCISRCIRVCRNTWIYKVCYGSVGHYWSRGMDTQPAVQCQPCWLAGCLEQALKQTIVLAPLSPFRHSKLPDTWLKHRTTQILFTAMKKL